MRYGVASVRVGSAEDSWKLQVGMLWLHDVYYVSYLQKLKLPAQPSYFRFEFSNKVFPYWRMPANKIMKIWCLMRIEIAKFNHPVPILLWNLGNYFILWLLRICKRQLAISNKVSTWFLAMCNYVYSLHEWDNYVQVVFINILTGLCNRGTVQRVHANLYYVGVQKVAWNKN